MPGAVDVTTHICTICEGDFDPDTEGGSQGYIGILPVNFCPTCVTGIYDFVQATCWRCIEAEDEDEDL